MINYSFDQIGPKSFGALVVAGFISGTLSANLASAQQIAGPYEPSGEAQAYVAGLVSPSGSIGGTVDLSAGSYISQNNDSLAQAITNFYSNLESDQVPLGDTFADILEENFWDMCVRV